MKSNKNIKFLIICSLFFSLSPQANTFDESMNATPLNSGISKQEPMYRSVHTNARPFNFETPRLKIKRDELSQAIIDNDTEKVKALLESGTDVNVTDSREYTPLHWAASRGYVEITQLLLEYKADVNATDIDDWTPLLLAILNEHEEVVSVLLQANADIHARTKTGKNSVGLSLYNESNENITITNMLINEALERGGSEEVSRLAIGSTSTFRPHWSKRITSFITTLPTKVEEFHNKKIQETLSTLNTHGATSLHKAARNGNINLIEDIFKSPLSHLPIKWIPPTVYPGGGWRMDYPGHYTYSTINHEEPYGWIIDYSDRRYSHPNGGDFDDPNLGNLDFVNIRDHNGWTPLHYAEFYDQPEAAHLLVENGADTEAKNNNGDRPTDLRNMRTHRSSTEINRTYSQ